MEKENKKIMYLSDEEIEKLNEYEKEHQKISYRTLLNKLNINRILCNNIIEIDEFLLDNIEVGKIYDEENGYYNDIYQYFIIDCNEWDIEYIKKYYNNELIIAYSEKLDNYILLVDHFGTAWDYVLTDVSFSSNWKEVNKIHEEQEKLFDKGLE